MINFIFELQNPFCRRWATVFYKGILIGANKSVELQVEKDSTIVIFGLQITTRRDHAGIDLTVGLFGYSAMLSCHDTRHWNSEENRYSAYDSAGHAL